MPKFRVGDPVAFVSHGGSVQKAKTGVIVSSVRAGEAIKAKYTDSVAGRYGVDTRKTKYLRDHESYVVCVFLDSGKKRFYWPRVSTLFPA